MNVKYRLSLIFLNPVLQSSALHKGPCSGLKLKLLCSLCLAHLTYWRFEAQGNWLMQQIGLTKSSPASWSGWGNHKASGLRSLAHIAGGGEGFCE